MKKEKPIVYIKPGCPWCRDALTFFDRNGVDVDIRDVLSSKSDMDRMVQISGQTKTPTMEYKDIVVADFSVDELLSELDQQPEIKKELGLGDDDN